MVRSSFFFKDTFLTSNEADISMLSLRQTAVLFIEAVEQCELVNGSSAAIVEMIDLEDSFTQTEMQFNEHMVSVVTSEQPETRTGCGCDTDAYITDTSLSDEQFIACMTECLNYNPNAGYCMDTTAINYLGALPCQDASSGGFGDTFVGGLVSDLWEATTDNLSTILGAFLGTNPGGGTNSGGGDDDDDDDDDDKDTAIDWGKIAIWGGVVIAVGLGAYFVFKKK
mgnify:CR=1 FL=1